MATKNRPKKTTGAEWVAATGQIALGLTLPAEERDRYRVLAATLGLSMAELSRQLARWALVQGPKKTSENLSVLS